MISRQAITTMQTKLGVTSRKLSSTSRRRLRRGLGSASITPPAPPTRFQLALAARENDPVDFFGGWTDRDVRLLRSHRPDSNALEARRGVIVDWLGIQTDLTYHPALAARNPTGARMVDLPIPDDGFHAQAIEYTAMLTAINRAKKRGQESFAAVELGASYGPWSTAAGVVARRAGFEHILLLAVEASSGAEEMILAHAARNGLATETVDFRTIHAAVHTHDQLVYFPRVNAVRDNGAQLSADPSGKRDYRGKAIEYDEVQGLSLETLLDGIRRVDFLHMDLQGAEEELLLDGRFLGVLDSKVAVLFLATQSRLIEGLALRHLGTRGWQLHRERPTTFAQNTRTNDPNGWTLGDGGQIWINKALK